MVSEGTNAPSSFPLTTEEWLYERGFAPFNPLTKQPDALASYLTHWPPHCSRGKPPGQVMPLPLHGYCLLDKLF